MKKKPAATGFTLVELLIVITLIVMLLLTASALFLTFLTSNTKGNAQQRINDEGDYALSQMAFLIRNAISLEQNSSGATCSSNMDEIVVKSLDGGSTSFFAEEDAGVAKIASNSGVYLTSGYADLVSGPTFNCTQASDEGAKFVTIEFMLRKGTPGIDQEKEIVEQTFKTSVSIRSF